MSRLHELIQKLCPDGVGYKSFGECAVIIRGASPRPIKNYITTDTSGINWIKIGDVKAGTKYITETAEKITKEGAKRSRFVKKGDFVLSNSMSFGRPYIMEIDGCIHDGWLAISEFSNSYLSDFLYHLLSSKECQDEMKKRASFGGAVQNLNADIVRALVLPVPPIPIQEEIVRVLDTFSDCIVELKAKLQMELQARKKQYEYYLEEVILSCHDYKKMKLEEICSVYDGTHQTPQYTQEGVKFVSVENIDKLYATKKFISEEAFQKYKIKPQFGDVLMTRITAGIIGKCTVVDRDEPLAYYVSLALLRPNNEVLDSKYLKYYIESGYGKKELKKYILADATPPKINKDAIGKISILVPTINEQKSVVRRIESLNRVSEGVVAELSREIDARQKQYEYYRDKLLTFKERTI